MPIIVLIQITLARRLLSPPKNLYENEIAVGPHIQLPTKIQTAGEIGILNT